MIIESIHNFNIKRSRTRATNNILLIIFYMRVKSCLFLYFFNFFCEEFFYKNYFEEGEWCTYISAKERVLIFQ